MKLVSIEPQYWDPIQFGDQTLIITRSNQASDIQRGQRIGLSSEIGYKNNPSYLPVTVERIETVSFFNLSLFSSEDIQRSGCATYNDLIEDLEIALECDNLSSIEHLNLIYFTPPQNVETFQNVRDRLTNGFFCLISSDALENIQFSYFPANPFFIVFEEDLNEEDFTKASNWLKRVAPHTEFTRFEDGAVCFALPLNAFELKARFDFLDEISQRRFRPPSIGPVI